MNAIDQDCCVFVSEDGKRFINTYKGSPCFSRSSHDRILALKGIDQNLAHNVTVNFQFKGKGQSIKEFLK